MNDEPTEEELQAMEEAGIITRIPNSFIQQLKKIIAKLEEEE